MDNIINFKDRKNEKSPDDAMRDIAKMLIDIIRIPVTQIAHKIKDEKLRTVSVEFIKSATAVEEVLKDYENITASDKDKKDFMHAVSTFEMSLRETLTPFMLAELKEQERGGVK